MCSDLDIWREVEKDHALEIRHVVAVDDGVLDVSFSGTIDAAIIAAIDVRSAMPDSIGPSPPEAPAAIGSYGRVLIEWSPPPDDDVAAYRIYRSDSQEGPFEKSRDPSPQAYVVIQVKVDFPV